MAWTNTGSIRGPQGVPGATGPAGPAGEQGPQGPAGPQGVAGVQGEQGVPGGVGPEGPAGPAGPAGPTGPQGPAGTGINLKGSVPTYADLPSSGQQQGDAYVVQDESDTLYVWDAEAPGWVNAGEIQGPAGPTGPAGPEGPTGPQGIQGEPGATGPAGPQGVQGVQGPAGAAGPAGERGTGWFVGSGPPPASIAGSKTGDLYLDTSTGDVYVLEEGPAGIPVGDLPAIGASFEGGYYGGLISMTGDGVATHALVIAPKPTGESAKAWKTANTATSGTDSVFDGYANCEAMNDANHPAAQWARALTIGGYTDWYLPSQAELEILYRKFKPDDSEGSTPGYGANAYAVPPTSNDYGVLPGVTTVSAFLYGGAQEFFSGEQLTSTQASATTAISQDWFYGSYGGGSKTGARACRAIRKVAVVP